MMWLNGGWSWVNWSVMVLAMVAFWSLMIYMLLWVLGGERKATAGIRREANPQEILDHRLARGEIDVEDYAIRPQTLHSL